MTQGLNERPTDVPVPRLKDLPTDPAELTKKLCSPSMSTVGMLRMLVRELEKSEVGFLPEGRDRQAFFFPGTPPAERAAVISPYILKWHALQGSAPMAPEPVVAGNAAPTPAPVLVMPSAPAPIAAAPAAVAATPAPITPGGRRKKEPAPAPAPAAAPVATTVIAQPPQQQEKAAPDLGVVHAIQQTLGEINTNLKGAASKSELKKLEDQVSKLSASIEGLATTNSVLLGMLAIVVQGGVVEGDAVLREAVAWSNKLQEEMAAKVGKGLGGLSPVRSRKSRTISPSSLYETCIGSLHAWG